MTSKLPETSTQTIYNQDFYLWIETTAKLLREKKFDQLDCENLIEEIEGMGRSEKQAIRNNLIVVLMHLLKYKYQPQNRTNSWRYTIREHRRRLRDAFEDSPSLKPYFQEVFDRCYEDARKEASDETGLVIATFPPSSPFSYEETLNPDYLPN
jgi:hypothetical protein